MSLFGASSTQGALAAAFARAKKEKRAAFVPFLLAGDPDLRRTPSLLSALVAGGADVIEIGVPFSDPIADGPTNQKAAFRSLEAGTNLSSILELVSVQRSRLDVPIVLFSYFNPIHAYGVEQFAKDAAAAGVDGVLCVDLPPEEGDEELTPSLQASGVDPVYLLAPTSTRARVRRVSTSSRGFVYYVSRTGVTGARSELAPELVKEVKALKRRLRQPVAVGFGISSKEQVAAVADVADGVVVGSALVRIVEEHGDADDLPWRIEAAASELAKGLAGSKALG